MNTTAAHAITSATNIPATDSSLKNVEAVVLCKTRFGKLRNLLKSRYPSTKSNSGGTVALCTAATLLVVQLCSHAVAQTCTGSILPVNPAPTSWLTSARSSVLWDPDGTGPAGPVVVAAPNNEGGIIAWDPGTTNWISLRDGFGGSALALVVLTDGRLVSAGTDGVNEVNLWSGSTWQRIGQMDQSGTCLVAMPDGSLIAGGLFAQMNGQTVNGIARWNGSGWAGMGGGTTPAPQVRAMALAPDGSLYVGGRFTTIGGVTSRNIGKWDGFAWHPVGGGIPLANTEIYSLAVDARGHIFAGGLGHNGMYEWDGTSWIFRGVTAITTVQGLLAHSSGDIIAVGNSFNGSPSVLGRWNGSSWSVLVGPNQFFRSATELSSGDVFVNGNFFDLNGQPAQGVAIWDAPHPTIATPPIASILCPGGEAEFSVVASGNGPFVYQWQVEDADLAAGWRDLADGALVIDNVHYADLNGTRAVTMHVQLVSGTMPRRFRAAVSNACGRSVSSAAVLTVCQADFNCDVSIDFFDYLDFVAAFSSNSQSADFNMDSVIDFFDYLDFVAAFSTGC